MDGFMAKNSKIKECLFIFIFVLIFFHYNIVNANKSVFISGSYLNNDIRVFNNEIDWDDIPELKNARDFAIYLDECIEERMNIIPLKFTNGFGINPNIGVHFGQKILTINAYRWDYCIVSSDNNLQEVIFVVYYYPGLRIADAYESGDTSQLTNDEKRVYSIVLPFIEELESIESDLVKEQLIHDKIISSTRFKYIYFSRNQHTLRDISALGVFLNHSGNCQAHSDAFYMLGRMAGLEVGIMRGFAFGDTHMWNTIKIGENEYFVDLTFNRNSFSDNNGKSYTTYYYFNAPREIMNKTHSWDTAFEINTLQDSIDSNYFYCSPEHFSTKRQYFGITEENPKDAIDSVANGVAKYGWKYWYAMVPYDKYYSNVNNVLNYFGKSLAHYNWYGKYYINIKTSKNLKYMYYTFVMNN